MTTLREEVDIIVKEASGQSLKAETIVELAKDKERFPSLHRHLWEVPEADLAAEARVQRAHRLLINIRIVTGEGYVTRLMVNTSRSEGYRQLSDVVTNKDLAAEKLRQLSEDIGRARQRLRAFRAALPDDVANDVDDLLEKAQIKAVGTADTRAVLDVPPIAQGA